MDDDDVHFCMKCNCTFVGLGVYVVHRQNECRRHQSSETASIYPSDALYPAFDVEVYTEPSLDREHETKSETLERNHQSYQSSSTAQSQGFLPNFGDHIYCVPISTQSAINTCTTPSLIVSTSSSPVSTEMSVCLISPSTTLISEMQLVSSEKLNSPNDHLYQHSATSISEFLASLELTQRKHDLDDKGTNQHIDEFEQDFFSSLELRPISDTKVSNNKKESCIANESEQLKGEQVTIPMDKTANLAKQHETSTEPAEPRLKTVTDANRNADKSGKNKDSFTITAHLNHSEENEKHDAEEASFKEDCKKDSPQNMKEDIYTDERFPNFKLSNLWTDLEIDSDSEDLPSDVEDLINFTEDEFESSHQHQTGGKVKPGYHAHIRGGKHGKTLPVVRQTGKVRPQSGGKWRPGYLASTASISREATGRSGKLLAYKGYRGLTDSEDEEEAVNDAQEKSEDDESVNKAPARCVTCNKNFSSKYYLDNHIKTDTHKQKLAEAATNKNKHETQHECPICKKTFNRKDNLIRHLYLKVKRRNDILGSLPDHLQVAVYQFLNYQCRICKFSTDAFEEFTDHIESKSHQENCREMLGAQLCVRCKFSSRSYEEMKAHFSSSQHNTKSKQRSQPCILKESKTLLKCKDCEKEYPTVAMCQRHWEVVHSGQNIPRVKTRGARHRPFCPCCNRQWPSESALKTHMHRRRSEKPWRCEICQVAFSNNSDLRRHCRGNKHLDKAVELGNPASATQLSSSRPSVHEDSSSSENLKHQSATHVRLKTINTINNQTLTYSNCPSRIVQENSCNSEVTSENHNQQCITMVKTVKTMKDHRLKDFKRRRLTVKDDRSNSDIQSKNDTRKLPLKTVPTIQFQKLKDSKGYTCHFEGCKFRASKLRQFNIHYEKEHGARFHCNLCNYSAKDKSKFRRHLTSVRHKRLSACHITDPIASDTEQTGEQKLEGTITNIFNDKDNPDNDSRTKTTGSCNNNKTFVCSVCSLSFANQESLTKHKMLHIVFSERQFIMQQCNGDELKYLVEKHHQFVKNLPTDLEDDVTCPECSQSTKRSSIVEHLRSHTNIRPYKCIFCSYSCCKGPQLRRHINIHHLPSKTVKCSHCDQRCISKRHLAQHMLRKHRDKINFKPEFICFICGKEFAIRSKYSCHMRIHAGRPYRCTYPKCSLSFPTKERLKEHSRKHSPNKPYLCSVCGFRAKWASQLYIHQKFHFSEERKFKCDYCTFSAVTVDNFNRHMRIHSGAKAFMCPQCDFKTSDITRLRKHVRQTKSHRGLMLYKCHLCDVKFQYATEIKAHLCVSHGLEKSSSDVLELSGIYNKSLDKFTVDEGEMVVPVREQFSRHRKPHLI